MLVHQAAGIVSNHPALALLAIVAFIYFIVTRFYHRSGVSVLPVVKVDGRDVIPALESAQAQYGEKPFMLSLPGMNMAVLPPSEIETIKALPETEVSIKKHHYDVFLGEYTYMGTKADEFDRTMRHTLTRNTPKVLDCFNEEVEYAVNKMIGSCEDWTVINPRHAMSRIASIMSARLFVGLPLSREDRWTESTVNYTGGVSQAWLILRLIPRYVRDVVAPFLPQVRALKQQKAANERELARLIAQRSSDDHKHQNVPGGEMLDWFSAQYSKAPTSQELARDQMLTIFASIYNLSNALTYVIFDLAALTDEEVGALRDEVLAYTLEDGRVEKSNMPKLRKLDSFVKESQRLSPPSLVNIPRIVTNPKGLRCKSGDVLPYGTRLTINAHAINQNPASYPDPAAFKPFRFSERRGVQGDEHKYQHATTGIDNINFGHGIWACPGRFLASAEIKVVLCYMLRHYDIKLPKGTSKPKQQHYGLAIYPDASANVEFKRRGGSGK
ncbi:hypothetical protein CAC42_6852 [Sphaceloma murrayae]|uniref:Ent-kaurene oxidase n=1 Tax=Sphaceloma murrayae TaxID=2082308 RepID=A0A2K1QHF3_9PEZI|nr:hypothetical protein CAC42_6852 [Sphaceloma murrayae]